MKLAFIVGVIIAGSVVVHTTLHTTLAVAAQGESRSALEQSYLYKATEGQQAELALGQLAVQKAANDRVKQYGARMMQDHQRVSEGLQKLIRMEGPRETGELSMPHQRIQRMLSQLSGKDFDKAYMAFMVSDHMKELGEWQQRTETVADPRVEHWIATMLPILNDHLEQGRSIAAAIGVTVEDIAKVEEATSSSHPY